MTNAHFPGKATEVWGREVTWTPHLPTQVVSGIRKTGSQERPNQKASRGSTVCLQVIPWRQGCYQLWAEWRRKEGTMERGVKTACSHVSAAHKVKQMPAMRENLAP